MRETFSKSLVDHIKTNPNSYLLSGDHGYALFDQLRKERPQHFLNAGVAEQNMVGVGAGLAKSGLYPIMYGLSAFIPVRVLEQIKIDFCYENLPGLFLGDGAGVVYSHLGTSHQSTEDVAVLRAIPNLTILSPCDKHELKACFEWAVKQKSTVYMRMGKADLGDVHSKEIKDFNPANVQKVFETPKSDFAIAATGSMVKVAKNIAESGRIKADVYSVPGIKPIEVKNVLKSFEDYKKVAVLEEHSIYGGLGSAFAEIFAESSDSPLLKRIGILDRFSELCGTYDYLMTEHGLDSQSVIKNLGDFMIGTYEKN